MNTKLNYKLIIVLSILLVLLLSTVAGRSIASSQIEIANQLIVQKIEQQKLSSQLLSQRNTDQPSFDLNLYEIPAKFTILSEAPELRIGYQRSKLFRFWIFFCILPFIPILFLLGGLATVWQDGLWEIIRYSLGEAISFVLVGLIWGLLVGRGLWIAFETVEYRAFHESFTVMHQSVGIARSQTVLSTDIQSFNVFVDRSRDGIKFNLEVVSYPSIKQSGNSSSLDSDSKQTVNHTPRRIKLYRDSSVNQVVWLGIVLADFYNTEFQVSE